MAYENILRRHGRNRGSNRKIIPIPQQDWRGVNYVDEIYTMPEHQLPYTKNVDLGNPIGAITKVGGRERLFTSLGAGKMLGLYNWQHSEGDKLLAAHDKHLYLLSGDSGSIAKTSKEDFDAGVKTNVETASTPGDVKLVKSGTNFSETDTLTADFNGTHSQTVAASNSVKLDTGTDTYTKLLLHCDGEDSSTTFTDETGKTVTPYGAYLSTAQKKFGTASGYFNGSSYYLSVENSNDFNFGTGDFTIDWWARFNALPTSIYTRTLISKIDTVDLEWITGWYVYVSRPSDKYYICFRAYLTGQELFYPIMEREITLAQDTWYHIAVVRSSNNFMLFQDGTRLGESATYTGSIPNPSVPLSLGCRKNDQYFSGYMDEIRISKGVARWTENFTPPTSAYTITGYVSPGIYTHPAQDISGIGVTTGVTVAFNKTTPANTAVEFETRASTDGGGSYGSWTTRTSGQTIIPSGTDVSNYRVQWRATLTSTDTAVTPTLDDVTLAGNTGYYTSGQWLSPVYDIGQTPLTALLSWVQTVDPGNTAVAWYARGSSNGTVFGDWQEILASGNAIPLLRYCQFKFLMTGTLTATPTVSSFLVSYSSLYSKANRLDISPLGRVSNLLTGNRVRFQKYEDRCYCADGLRPFVLYMDADTQTSGMAQSLVLNPLFANYTGTINDDTEDTFTSWTNFTQCTGRTEAVTGGFGGVAVKAVQTDATAVGFRGVAQVCTLAAMGLNVGDAISLQARYKCSAQVTSSARIFFTFRDSGGGTIINHYLLNSTAEQSAYATVKLENVTIPANTYDIRFMAMVRSSGAYSGQNNWLIVDYFCCTKSNAIVLASGASAVNDFYNNAFITITGGTGAGQVRFISDYDGAAKIATVSEDWTTAPDATSTYSIGAAAKARKAGVDPPATACSAAAGASTGLTGTFYYKYTYVNRDGYESNPSAASGSVTVSNQKISVSNIAVGDSTVTDRKLYRTKAGGSVYYYVTTINNNTATTYTDSTADSSLTTLMLDNNNIPPNASIIYQYLTYMFYCTGNEMWFSKAGEPEQVPNITGDRQVNILPGDILDLKANPMALIPMGENFLCPITSNTGFIFDSDPAVDTTTMRQIDKVGSFSFEASDICIDPQLRSILVFPTDTGIRTILPGLQEESLESIPLSRNIQPYFDLAVNRHYMAAVFYNSYYIISMECRDPDASENEYVTFAYDFRHGEWYGPWTFGSSCYAVCGNVLYAGDTAAGKVYRMFTGNSFDGENIEMVADLPMVSPGGENRTYRFLRFMAMVSAESNTAQTEVKAKVDNREVIISLGAQTNTFTGDERPGHNNIRSRKYRIPLPKGNTLSYRIVDDSTNPVSIQKVITDAEILPLKR